ncbi:hypothetical protein DZK55_23915 [Escherichia coli]|nr:hypothetical protein [Klebsiella pneumoniae]PWY15532.1 hypothetical protein DL345_00870 [Citrobacter koseri]RGE35598.1 hypothetical protein DZK55_23915 [Escherichia coli]MBL2624302.1 hypothetical protein [Klebsiella pneumoniae]MBL2652358.1 hypothetical protein [Klebsiella pneumoniae]
MFSTEKRRANLSPDLTRPDQTRPDQTRPDQIRPNLTGTLHLAAALPPPDFLFTQSAPGPPSAPDPLPRFSRRATLR